MSSSGRNSCSSDVTKFDGREEGVREGVEHIITVIAASDGQDIDLFTFLKNLITKAFGRSLNLGETGVRKQITRQHTREA